MPADAGEIAASSIARFNKPGRELPRMGENGTGDNAGAIKPRLAKVGYTRFLTLANLDGRSRAVANCNALKAGFETDLGGADTLSTGQAQLVQRAAMLGIICEDYETRHLLGQPIEVDQYLTSVNVLRRVLCTIGLQRQARDVGSSASLSEYLRARSAPEEDVVVGVNGTHADPVVERGLELAPEAVPSGLVEPVGESETPAGRVPAPSPETRSGDAPQSQPDAFVEASSPAAARPGNGAAP
jgi:hypothetical protein